jgi:antitoxin Phd
MERQFTIAEAKSRLPAIIHSVEDGPSVKLTRHGKPVAVLLSICEYEQSHLQWLPPSTINECPVR